jgi:hypothetical protein
VAKRIKRSGTTKHPSGLTTRSARIERARPFKWAWDQRVLLSYLNLLIGEEGIGKGNLVAWLGARITRGDLPGDLEGEPRRVALVGDEDSWDNIWVPRFTAAGADETLLTQITSGLNGVLDVRTDADALGRYIKAEGVGLVYLDQLLDNLGVTDNWKDKQVRDALNPLIRVAQETEAALLASMHPNKRGGSFRDRISGTPAFNALSRSSLFAMQHPDDPGRKVVVRGKGNYTVEPDAFEFRISEEVMHLKRPARRITTSKITDLRETALRRDELLAADGADRRRSDSKAGDARALLSGLFADGNSRPASEVLELCAEHGIPERVARSALAELGLTSQKVGYQGAWHWGPPRPKRTVRRSKRS